MDRNRRYGMSEDRSYGRDEDFGGRGFGSRDDEDRERGGFGRDRSEGWQSRSSMLGSRDDDWRGRGYAGGYQGSGMESDRDDDRMGGRDIDRDFTRSFGRDPDRNQGGGYGRMGLGERGGWGSSHGMGSRDRESPQQGYGSGTQRGYGSGRMGGNGGTTGYGGSYGHGALGGYGGYGRSEGRDHGNRDHGNRDYGAREWGSQQGSRELGGRGREGGDRDEDRDEQGGLLHRMGEGFKNVFGMNDRDRGPHFGKGPKGYKRSDERIREEVSEVIARQGWIDASDVEVKVQNGEVTLTGTIDQRDHKRRLEQMIEDLPGVDDVRNELRVKRAQLGAGGTYASGDASTTESPRPTGRNARTS